MSSGQGRSRVLVYVSIVLVVLLLASILFMWRNTGGGGSTGNVTPRGANTGTTTPATYTTHTTATGGTTMHTNMTTTGLNTNTTPASSGENATTTTREYGTITIGMSVSLSGKFEKEGRQLLCGALASINWYNSHGGIQVGGRFYKLKLKYYDDLSRRENVQALYEKLILVDGVNFLLGPYSSGLTIAAAPIAEEYGIL
ncbi:MAG: ABC transporter substrate-binding protein, partial [Desulfurococcales archaeon]|nr:ABC transporter substrate-binding protein [Desulfurococcales archaeon]